MVPISCCKSLAGHAEEATIHCRNLSPCLLASYFHHVRLFWCLRAMRDSEARSVNTVTDMARHT